MRIIPRSLVRAGFLALLACAVPAAAHGAESPYLIGEGDVLSVTVWKNPELSVSVTVRPDGNVTLPLLQEVAVAGLETTEARRRITELLSKFVNEPLVTVGVVETNSRRVYTLGAVAVNGMFSLPAPKTPVQLLAEAGGALPAADLGAAFIVRGERRLPLDMEAYLAGKGDDRLPMLEPGDILVVPQRKEAEVDRVLVVGEVQTPQSLDFRPGMTALDAAVACGGGTEFSRWEDVMVLRLTPGGERERIEVDLKRAMKKGDLTGNLILSPGDIMVVP